MADRISLAGRDPECALITRLLDEVTRHGATLVIRGTPGVGKTALLDWADAAAGESFRTLRTAGSAAEFGLPYAALHQLLRPVLGHALQLSRRRRDALEVAFGQAADGSPQLYSVAMAALDLLAEVAVKTPVLILADDVQWMDPSSRQALAFIGRRIAADRIVLLATHRDGEDGPLTDPPFHGIDLAALDPSSAAELLDRGHHRVDARTRTVILDVAGGNPLALLELPRTLTAAEGTPDIDRLPLTRRLERSFGFRIGELDTTTRTALSLAALNDTEDLAEVVAATELLTGNATSAALDPAVSARLITIDGSAVHFAHPLIRSSLYQQLSPATRRAGHDALARALRDHPERAVWHRAAAAIEPDPALAAQLEQQAEHALKRGATVNAVQAFERSALLSVAAGDRGRRLFRAASLAFAAGRTAQGDGLRSRYRDLIEDDADRIRYEWLCELSGTDRGADQRVDVLVELAGQAHALADDVLAVQFLHAAALRCWNFRPDQPIGKSVIAAADRLVPIDPAARAGLLAHGAPFESADDVLKIIASVPAFDRDATTTFRLAHAAACVGAVEVAEPLFTVAVEALRVEGRLHTLATALVLLSWSALRRGRWAIAVSAAEEGSRLCAETDQPFWHACGLAAHAVIAAQRGNFDDADQLTHAAELVAAPHQFAAAEAVILIARAASAAGQGQHDRALTHLLRLHDPGDSAHHPVHGLWSIAGIADAAMACGEVGTVRQILAELRPDVRRTRSPAGQMNITYAEAVIALDADVEDGLPEAVHSTTTAWPIEHHRLALTYGTWLRRQKRARESRDYLRAARDGFERLGARPWAERARGELRAAGEQSLAPATDAWESLSPQELQIASMAARGLTNREIGQRLFISHRTVGAYLYRLFPKLGISSRTELIRMAAGRPEK